MSTFMAKKETVQPKWYVIDATDQVVGRLAVVIANIIRGKYNPQYTFHCDTGDFVIITNAEKVKFTGNKWETKQYKSYTHYAGGLKERSASEMLEKRPTEILRLAVKRMLPKGPQAYKQLSKVKLFVGPEHSHQAQQPVPFNLDQL